MILMYHFIPRSTWVPIMGCLCITLTGFLVIFVKKIKLSKGPIHLIPNLRKNRVSTTDQLPSGTQNQELMEMQAIRCESRNVQSVQQSFNEFSVNLSGNVETARNFRKTQNPFLFANNLQHVDNLISIVIVFILIGILCLFMFGMFFARLYELATELNSLRYGYVFQSFLSVAFPTLYFLFNPRCFMIAVKELVQLTN